MTEQWHVAQVVGTTPVTASARAVTLAVPGFAGAVAGQHVDVRLTAPDGYQAARSYSLAAVGADERVELAVDRVPDGEVSPYLVDELRVGDRMEVRGPLGGWFVWRPEDVGPVQLVAGGSGIVPLAAMVRARRDAGPEVAARAPFRLLYSVRTPQDAFFADELEAAVDLTWAYTRRTPPGWPRPARRLDAADLAASTFAPSDDLTVLVCGPTAFVETVAGLLLEAGHDPARVKTERFGGAS
ncbi:ferredoxin-NADP reductase [Sediminihabitans luteus]|uniref:Ferredoxin-NADP reductase n=1 Tax=Sediminihabitans luteus TaxID=1138585 RepID=A0A2M9CEJ2_9CELL|nr:ferredoxin reductase [Sediminihabitans luteus]PJJ70270.1 ferredoxin-NADP reductase [Sediminihabitans luteus]GII97741.1 oxidoreductase [Sediminihabitans luteus]